MPTPQTLRESFKEEFACPEPSCSKIHYEVDANQIADFFLSHFSTFLEKEIIGNEKECDASCKLWKNNGSCSCGMWRENTLRKHQRIIGKEYLK